MFPFYSQSIQLHHSYNLIPAVIIAAITAIAIITVEVTIIADAAKIAAAKAIADLTAKAVDFPFGIGSVYVPLGSLNDSLNN